MDEFREKLRKTITIVELQELIDRFEALPIQSPIKVIKEELNLVLNRYTCMTRRMESNFAFRARINEGEAVFTNYKEIWYPPAEKVKTYGRLNRPGQSMFYISASHDTAILEVRPKVGDLVTVLRVKLRNPRTLPHVMEVGVAETSSQYKLGLKVHIFEQTNARNLYSNPHDLEMNLMIRSLLAKYMMKIVPRGNELEFKKTVAIGENQMSSDRVDGLLFPSIAGDGTRKGGGMNMALKPTSADNLFVPDQVWLSRVEDIHGMHSYVMRCINKATVGSNGQIFWQQAL